MIKKFVGLMMGGLLLASGMQAQDACGTDDVMHKLKATHPEIAIIEQQLEAQIQQRIKYLDLQKLAKTTIDDTTFYDVPIVIHLTHDYGQEYLSDDAIFNAVAHWATIFVATNPDTADVISPFKPYIGNARIKLRLATKDPNGNPTKGITRRQSYLTFNAGDQAKLDGWPNDSYLNIWFVNTFSGNHSGAAAYAYYPSSGAMIPYYDGIIGLYSYLDYDKAIPHEIGHSLNLQHTWGNTNAPNVACGNDLVDDTPPTKGHLTTGCVPASLYDTNCATNNIVVTPNGIIDYPDTTNAQNIMDYTYCQKMFTKGQVERMRISLTSNVAGRNNLFSAANLAATGALAPRPDLAPVPEFSMDKVNTVSDRFYFLCANDATKFIFRNKSWNDTITSIAWTFSNNATLPTSNGNNVFNQFGTPGWVTVSLTATGNNTGSTTLTDTRAVYVADPNVISPTGYKQNFASQADFDKWPIFNYYKNDFKWEPFSGAGYSDGACVRYRSFDARTSPANKTGTPAGDFDDIVSIGFDLSSFTSGPLNINFRTSGAYVPSNFGVSDSMEVMASIDCGRTWQNIQTVQGSNLLNMGAKTSEFMPTSAADWKAQTINIPNSFRTNKVFIKFRYWPGSRGNNVYLDDFTITPYTTEVSEIANNPSKIKVYPNPSKDDVKLVVNAAAGKMSYTIKDITGKIIYTKAEQNMPTGIAEETIARSSFGAPGLYFITVTIANKTFNEKVVIQ